MRTITTTVYQFSELSDEAKQKAIDNNREINVNFEWWEFTYDDAERIGLKITSFDCDQYANGHFIDSAEETAEKIVKEHGENCETFKTAQTFLKDLAKLRATDDKEDEEEELKEEFLKSLLEDYRIILRNEYEYLMSDEAVIETIEVNEYEFTEEGERA